MYSISLECFTLVMYETIRVGDNVFSHPIWTGYQFEEIVNYMVSVTTKGVTEIVTLHLTTVSCHTSTGIFRSVVINDDLGMWAWRIYIATNNLVDVSVYNDDDMARYINPKWHIKICIAVESTGILYPKYARLKYQLVDRTSAGCQVPIG